MQSLGPHRLPSPNAHKPFSNARQCAVIFQTFSLSINEPFRISGGNVCMHAIFMIRQRPCCGAFLDSVSHPSQRLRRVLPAVLRRVANLLLADCSASVCTLATLECLLQRAFFFWLSQPVYVPAPSSGFFSRSLASLCATPPRDQSRPSTWTSPFLLDFGSAFLHWNW